MKFQLSDCLLLAGCAISATAYTASVSRVQRLSSALSAWPENRPPVPSIDFLDLSMDAAWGRGKFRTEVWEDDVNPVNDWWVGYAPSEEEVEAASKGYDFSNPKSYFESRNVNYLAAVAETEQVSKQRLNVYLQEKAADETALTNEEFLALQEQYFQLQKKIFNAAFRAKDNDRQIEKGQPSLDSDDTGRQWKNDPEEDDE